LLFTFVFLSF